jgi:translation elongation factor EF-G
MAAAAAAARAELVERVAEVDDGLAELFLAADGDVAGIGAADIRAAIRRAVIALKFVPVFLGSAYKNKGVQLLLDGVADYLPSPVEKANTALDRSAGEAPVALVTDRYTGTLRVPAWAAGLMRATRASTGALRPSTCSKFALSLMSAPFAAAGAATG